MDAFFNFSSDQKKFEAPKPQCEVKIKTDDEEVIIDFKREEIGQEYSKKYREREENQLVTRLLNLPSTSATIKVDSDDEDENLSSVKEEIPEFPELTVFQRYSFNLKPQDLPILKKREDIIEIIDRSRVVVLMASTGTGKSSQVPQYILEEAQKRKENCNIIVTQPRRIAGKIEKVSLF